MQKVTTLFLLLMLCAFPALAQDTDYIFALPTSDDFKAPFSVGGHAGARGISGPWDADGDGQMEVLLSEYTGGGRAHLIENTGLDSWELVYSTPWLDSTATSNNGRYATVGDLDGDGAQEIIMIAGSSYSLENNPNAGVFDTGAGVFVFEHTGDDNDFGDFPASVFKFDDAANAEILPVSNGYAEVLHALDIDNDGTQELLIPLNGSSTWDLFFIYSVTGTFEPGGAGTGFETWTQEFQAGARLEGNNLGGGSAIAMYPADLDGDGQLDLSIHAWNNFNFFNAIVLGADQYAIPELTAMDRFIKASPEDHVAIYGGVAVDINGDGTDEVFYPRFQSFGTAGVSILNYDAGDDVLEINADHLAFDVLQPLSNLHLAAGDSDNDGQMELFGNGRALNGAGFTAGDPLNIFRVAEYRLGADSDPTDPANYSIEDIFVSHPLDSTLFNHVYRDSLGTMTDYYEEASGALAVAKLVYLGDVDDDGSDEIAAAFQTVNDSLLIIDEVWNADPDSMRYDRTVRETYGNENRIFMRVIELSSTRVSTEDRNGVPDGFALSPNFPNPFASSTTFRYTLGEAKRVKIKVYDVMGRVVKTIEEDTYLASGTHRATWDGTTDAGGAAASGTYFYTMEVDGQRVARPMILLK